MKSLRQLYKENSTRIREVRESFLCENMGGPFLMDLKLYNNQNRKLFIIGQESKGWNCNYKNIDSLLQTYIDFNMGEHYNRSPFWNITRKIEALMKIAPYSCAWSNINRYDHNGGAPEGGILEEIMKLDYLVKEELSVIQPDVCFFFTNRKYDYRLEELYSGLEMYPIEGLPKNHFCRLKHQNLPTLTFRTPHPRFIRMQKWEEPFLAIMNDLLP